MGKLLAEKSAEAKQLFAIASDILGFDLLKICVEGPVERLNRTEFCQPALFVHSYATLQYIRQERQGQFDSVAAVAGLSLGEYTAVAAAGGISFEAGVKLVQIRGQAMQQAADMVASGMSSILGLETVKLQAICESVSSETEFVRVANLLCPGNVAISGHLEALALAEKASLEAGAMKAVRLAVAGAFHTSLMQPAVDRLSEALSLVDMKTMKIPVFSNVDASPHSKPDEIRALLAHQVVTPVLWESTLRNLLAAGIDQFVELGAGRVLAGTLKRIDRKVACESIGE